jgi:hypothetical protein
MNNVNKREPNRESEWKRQGFNDETAYNRANGFGYGMGNGY